MGRNEKNAAMRFFYRHDVVMYTNKSNFNDLKVLKRKKLKEGS
jgi:hypothetical protein